MTELRENGGKLKDRSSMNFSTPMYVAPSMPQYDPNDSHNIQAPENTKKHLR